MADILSAAGVTVVRGNVVLRDLKPGETTAVLVLFKYLKMYGRETLISALQCITQTGSQNAGFVRARVVEALCIVLNKNLQWRDAGERLLRAMDSFDFIEAWDIANKRRTTVPRLTVPDVLGELLTEHLSNHLSGKVSSRARQHVTEASLQ